jgi:hypothetical protein
MLHRNWYLSSRNTATVSLFCAAFLNQAMSELHHAIGLLFFEAAGKPWPQLALLVLVPGLILRDEDYSRIAVSNSLAFARHSAIFP